MVTFNELLRVNGIDPSQVTILRHTGARGTLGSTVYDLWRSGDGSFDRYQSTQAADEPKFESPYWASFVPDGENETLFVGLYSAKKGDRSEIDWLCPMTGLPPGQEKGRLCDFYQLTPLEVMKGYRGTLKIEWDEGWVSWARYAKNKEYAVIGEVDTAELTRFEASPEGQETWRFQRGIERNTRLVRNALSLNAVANGGLYTCEACKFGHADGGMLDVHHLHPLAAGPRMTRASDLIVLCPICHRRAHRCPNRLQPYSLPELREWNEAGRP